MTEAMMTQLKEICSELKSKGLALDARLESSYDFGEGYMDFVYDAVADLEIIISKLQSEVL